MPIITGYKPGLLTHCWARGYISKSPERSLISPAPCNFWRWGGITASHASRHFPRRKWNALGFKLSAHACTENAKDSPAHLKVLLIFMCPHDGHNWNSVTNLIMWVQQTKLVVSSINSNHVDRQLWQDSYVKERQLIWNKQALRLGRGILGQLRTIWKPWGHKSLLVPLPRSIRPSWVSEEIPFFAYGMPHGAVIGMTMPTLGSSPLPLTASGSMGTQGL